MSAGDRLIIIFFTGNSKPLFSIAERTLCLASFIAFPGSPTMYSPGSPLERWTSIVTFTASTHRYLQIL